MACRSAPSEPAGSPSLQLLSGFGLSVAGRAVPLPNHAQRVLAFLAVHDRGFTRQELAERLWMDVSAERAKASLRTALWRIRKIHSELITSSYTSVALTQSVNIDLRSFLDEADRILSGKIGLPRTSRTVSWCNGDLLPTWDEDWIVLERQRLRQLRIHTLEALSRLLSGSGRHAQAVDAAYAAVSADPLRESARVVLIRAHLDEGNYAEAVRQYELFSNHIRAELGVGPSTELRSLIRSKTELAG